jgi:2-polyprenyl-3-methyl-5-hydroxy-6-metoxy-1,4-benzoquinol methylase
MKCLNCDSSKKIKTFISSIDKIEYFICGKCNCHVQLKPKKSDYEIGYWDGIIKDPDGKKRDMTKEREFKIKNWYGDIPFFLSKFKNKNILDVGCGLGFLLSSVKSKKKTGVEISEFAIKFIQKNNNDINIIKGDYNILKNTNRKFDIIIAYHVIEHVHDPNDFMQTLKSSLTKNGILIIGTPLINSFISNYFGPNYRLYNSFHTILYNEKALIELFNRLDLKIIKIEKPFFKTQYNTFKNFLRLFNKTKISPPFYGSIITIYAKS